MGYSYVDDSPMQSNIAVSTKNNPTPLVDCLQDEIDNLLKKMNDAFEEQVERNPVGLFGKMLMCFIACARIILGNNDKDVLALKKFVSSDSFNAGIGKELTDETRSRWLL